MFIDTAKVLIKAGDGGNGVVSFRHEKFVDRGGPDGGDGGKGGDVIFVADANLDTLIDFRYNQKLSAGNGGKGAKQNKHGKNGADLIVKVPVGTVVKPLQNYSDFVKASLSMNQVSEDIPVSSLRAQRSNPESRVQRPESIVADLTEPRQEVVIAKGGKGGFGNAHFKSSTRQAPRVAELGEKGESFELQLELKLLADVGLVGFPNAGKSTFLSVVTSAKPEIADYAFTTLIPNLGVADFDNTSLLIADIPGLIEGASEGKGLGGDFLRHIERTSVVFHIIDVLSDDVAGNYQKIRAELAKYSPELVKKPEVVGLSKIDTVDDEIVDMQKKSLSEVTKSPILAFSAKAHKNTTEVLRALKKAVNEARTEKDEAETSTIHSEELNGAVEPVISLSDDQRENYWHVEPVIANREERSGKQSSATGTTTFVVSGPKIEKFAARTDFENVHGVNRLRDIMKKMGITHELSRQGATGESLIRIGDSEFTLLEN